MPQISLTSGDTTSNFFTSINVTVGVVIIGRNFLINRPGKDVFITNLTNPNSDSVHFDSKKSI